MQAQEVNNRVRLENIVPFYQPIYALASRHVDRYECLARLLDSNQQVVLPNEFLYIVESHHETADMTSRILELSRAYCEPRHICWSINLFANDLNDKHLLDEIEQMCRASAKGLCGVELHFDCVRQQMLILAQLAKQIPNLYITVDEIAEWDDSLYSIVAAGINAIKIKSDMLKSSVETPEGRERIAGLKAHCTKHKCKLIAEHIEDEETLSIVKENDILYGQGFYLSHPVPKVIAVHNA